MADFSASSSPSGTVTVPEGNGVTTAAPVPTNAQGQSNTDCGEWYLVSSHISIGQNSIMLTGAAKGSIRRLLRLHLPQVRHLTQRLLLPEPTGQQQLHQLVAEHFVLCGGRWQYCNILRVPRLDCIIQFHKAPTFSVVHCKPCLNAHSEPHRTWDH